MEDYYAPLPCRPHLDFTIVEEARRMGPPVSLVLHLATGVAATLPHQHWGVDSEEYRQGFIEDALHPPTTH